MAALAIYAARDAGSATSRCAVTLEAPLFQKRREHAAQGRLIIRGFLFGKTELERQLVLLRVVKIPGFDQRRTRQRQTVQRVEPDHKAEAMPFAADRGFHRKIKRRLPWHLHAILQVPTGSGERILDHRSRTLRIRLGIMRWELRSGSALPCPGHVRAGLDCRDLFVAPGAYVAAQITAFAGARERGDHQQHGDPHAHDFIHKPIVLVCQTTSHLAGGFHVRIKPEHCIQQADMKGLE